MAKANSKKKRISEAEAAVLALQNAPVEVARDEAKHATDAPPEKPRRRRRRRKVAAAAAPKRRGRPKGSKNKPKPAANKAPARRGPGRPPKRAAAASGLGQINAVVERMVEERTKAVLRDAVAALKKATAAVESAL